jgi:glyoxylase-like metal-dependent hydrolase (beta-lactamase superfamily II)
MPRWRNGCAPRFAASRRGPSASWSTRTRTPITVYTNHLFPEATVIICTHKARETTRANQAVQEKTDASLARLFADVDLEGGRYTPQDMTFSGTLTLHQGEREVRVLELGPGHSESDVVVHLPSERILFCGDVFMSSMAASPGEGHVSGTIANYKAFEAIDAEIYVAGHGEPGTLADVRAQRMQTGSSVRASQGVLRARHELRPGLAGGGQRRPSVGLRAVDPVLQLHRVHRESARDQRSCESEPYDHPPGHRRRGQAAPGPQQAM